MYVAFLIECLFRIAIKRLTSVNEALWRELWEGLLLKPGSKKWTKLHTTDKPFYVILLLHRRHHELLPLNNL